jgi:hypothetical protein
MQFRIGRELAIGLPVRPVSAACAGQACVAIDGFRTEKTLRTHNPILHQRYGARQRRPQTISSMRTSLILPFKRHPGAKRTSASTPNGFVA